MKKNHKDTQNSQIESVIKIGEGTYKINDSVILSNISVSESGDFQADINYDEKLITEKEAEQLAQSFVSEALKNSL